MIPCLFVEYVNDLMVIAVNDSNNKGTSWLGNPPGKHWYVPLKQLYVKRLSTSFILLILNGLYSLKKYGFFYRNCQR